MLKMIVMFTLAMATLKDYANKPKPKDEAGLGTLEMVVIGLGLLVIATAAVAVITGAVNTRLNSIK